FWQSRTRSLRARRRCGSAPRSRRTELVAIFGAPGRSQCRRGALCGVSATPRRAPQHSRSTPRWSETRFFLAMGENGPYSETSFYLIAKFFRTLFGRDDRDRDVNKTSQERCGR